MYLRRYFSSLKKAATILLLALLLFNFIGYRLLFYYAEKEADKQTEAMLTEELYEENELIKIETPLSNPYQTSQSSFERISGEIILDGIIYKYVKRKISNGHLILMCLPDKKKTPLKNAKEAYFKKTNNLGQENNKSTKEQRKSNLIKGWYSEYVRQNDLPLLHNAEFKAVIFSQAQPFPIKSVTISAPGQPPDLI